MANVNAPFGFRPNTNIGGGTPARLGGYSIAFDYAVAMFSGDLVKSSGTGRDVTIVADDDTVERTLGIFAGCNYVNDSGDIVWLQYWPGIALADSAKLVECWVYDDPNLEYIAEMTTFAQTDVGLVFGYNIGTGNPVTGRSASEIDESDTTNLKLRIVGISEGIDGINQSETGAFAKVRCQVLSHERSRPGVATATTY
jgi:hypothetical protein